MSFPPTSAKPARWFPASQLDRSREGAFPAGDQVLGFVKDHASRQSLERAFMGLAAFSGIGTAREFSSEADQGCATLLDIWHCGGGLVRMRWRSSGGGGLVVRVLQQVDSQEPELIGEGLIEADLDTLDAQAHQPAVPAALHLRRADGERAGLADAGFPLVGAGGPSLC